MKHEDAFRKLPDLLDDRDDTALLRHVRNCADCQRQLFLLNRIDRALRDNAPTTTRRRPTRLRMGAALVAAAAAAAAVSVFLPFSARAHPYMLRASSGAILAEATMTHADARNVALVLLTNRLPVAHGHMFILWASDHQATMQAGRFMADEQGHADVRFNLPANHHWTRFWITRPNPAPTMIASTV